jgi:hypothetical protein
MGDGHGNEGASEMNENLSNPSMKGGAMIRIF